MEYNVYLILICTALVILNKPLEAITWNTQCRCVPDQWEGILVSTEHEFDLRGGRTRSTDQKFFVSYDYENQLFSITEAQTGIRAIADYKKGFKYVVREDECKSFDIIGGMRQMCIPEHAELLGENKVSTNLDVEQWEFVGPQNMTTVRTMILQSTCIPLTEEVFKHDIQHDAASLTTSTYLDVTLGINDPSVFDRPNDCRVTPRFFPQEYLEERAAMEEKQLKEKEAMRQRKRSHDHFRSRLFQMAD